MLKFWPLDRTWFVMDESDKNVLALHWDRQGNPQDILFWPQAASRLPEALRILADRLEQETK